MEDLAKTVDRLVDGTDDVVNPELLAQKLGKSQKTGMPLIVKLGVDPTAPDIHLGHTVVMEKLRQFQDLGHVVVFLIGDMTGRIGDPTDRAATRKQLSKDEVDQFARTYIEQANHILKTERMQVRYNSEWFQFLQLPDMIQLLSHITLARILERDDFHSRFEDHAPIHLHELLYPLMQGYDSVALRADVELGGTDQRFNIMTARQIQEDYGMEPEVGIFMPLLEGTDGVRKMSKSQGNHIGITEPARDMFGKVMSIPDGLIARWAHLLFGMDFAQWQKRVEHENPRDVKADLALRIVERFWDREHAERAAEEFSRTFSQRGIPSEMPVVRLDRDPWEVSAIELVAFLPGVASRQEARRFLQQGAVVLNDERLSMDQTVRVVSGDWIRVGRRRYYRFEE
ncbi:MAG: tyrosine--tRNA ligase [Firmicutes bacterium]|nr:tyrosine--tRNA ligase [Bacillota bacterium]